MLWYNHNAYFSLFPCQTYQGIFFFLVIHCENLIKFLKGELMKVWEHTYNHVPQEFLTLIRV